MTNQTSTLTPLLWLAVGATAGAALRYTISLWTVAQFGATLPYGTFIANMLGCMVLGGFLTLALERPQIGPRTRLLVSTGFCGSLTTFSTFSYETVALFIDGYYLAAVVNVLFSTGCGLAGVWVGVRTMQIILQQA